MTVESPTIELAKYWSEEAVGILFSEGDPFGGSVDQAKLKENIYNEIIRKLVDEETFELSEEEFQECVRLAKLN